MMRLITTRYGRPATATLHGRIAAAKLDDPLAPVVVVVPDNSIAVATRRSIASGSHGPVVAGTVGLVGVTFLTVFRLAEQLGAAGLAGGGRRPVSTPVIAAAIRQVLTDEPGVFAAVAHHPTTEKRLVSAHRDLSNLDQDELGLLARSPLARVRDLVRIHRAARALLAPHWYDEHDLVTSAIGRLDDGDALDANVVILHLPRDLTPPRARFFERLTTLVPVEVIAALTDNDEADRPLRLVLGQLGLGDDPCPPDIAAPAPALDVVSTSDPDDEVRHVVRGVVAAAHAGTPLDAMAVVHVADLPYRRLLLDHLAAAGVAVNGQALTLAESVTGRTLRRLLGLADRGFRRDDVIGLVASSPITLAGRRVPSRAWDRISRDAGVVRGVDDWRDRLAHWSEEARRELARLGDDPEWESRVFRLRRDLDHAAGLAGFVEGLGEELADVRGPLSWSQRAAWCRKLLRDRIEEPSSWPEAERRARDRVESALDRLAGLDAVEGSPSLAVFRRTLDLELESGLARAGSLGSGVFVGSPAMALGLDIAHLWVVGLAEGTFPNRQRDDSLLPDRERATVAGLAAVSERTADQHRNYLGILAAAGSGTAHLFWPRGDLRRGELRTPSRWLLDTVSERIGRAIAADDLQRLDVDWLRHVPSHAAGLHEAKHPATAQEYDIRRLLAATEIDGIEDSVLARNAALVEARGRPELTRYDGLVGPVDGPGDPTVTNRPMSATSLEAYARCPHQYFVRHVLGVEALEAPERRLRIDALERGRLVHHILERFVGEVAQAERSWQDLRRERLHTIADEELARAHDVGVTGAALYWRRDRVLLRRDLDRFFDIDRERRSTLGLRPVATELAFGLRGSDPVVMDLPDGRRLTMRGSIDLVDRADDGHLVVTDYKTGRLAKVTEADPHQGGTKLQLALYAIAARRLLAADDDSPVESNYWHIHAASRYDSTGYLVTAAIEAAVLAAVTTIVDLIGAGVFPQHPEESTRTRWVGCDYCDPDGLGVAEARRRFDRMVDDPVLRSYLALVEPDRHPSAGLIGVEAVG